jgi:hypothetical membrane protein
MSATGTRIRSASDVLAFMRTARTESAALLVSAGFLVLGFVVAFAVFWGRELAITGPGSVGFVAAICAAVVTVITVYLGRMLAKPDQGRDDGLELPGDRLRWYDMFSILAAYAGIALLGWQGVGVLISMAFTGAPVYPFPGAVLVAVAVAVTAYVAFLSSVHLDPMMLSFVLALFLVVGAFASMLTTGNPQWWMLALSELGATYNPSAWVFNATVVIAGVIVTTVARYATARLPDATAAQRRGRAVARWAVVVIGILLTLAGLVPLDVSLLLHNIFASGMAVVFIALVVAAPWLLPSLPRVFFVLGYAFVATIVLLVVFFVTGYYNLTAVELVVAILMFSWIIVFLRTAADGRVAHSR